MERNNKGQWFKGFRPWNAGIRKKYYCKTCGNEYNNKSYKKVYCSHECKLNGEWGKIHKEWNKGKKHSEEFKKRQRELAIKRKSHLALFRPEVRKKALENARIKNIGRQVWWINKDKVPWKFGSENVMWKGNNVGYHALHHWVNRILGKIHECVYCGEDQKRIGWASISHHAKRDLNDYIPLCMACHKKYDKEGRI